MNRINKILSQYQEADNKDKLLSIYFTAGYPELEDTATILRGLQDSGVDMVEIGLPFSDPLADGPTIQESSTRALKNGMTTQKLFDQLKDVRKDIHIPLLIMGYLNPMVQYGVEAFCRKCSETGIDGLIIPDLPVDVYNENYRELFERYGLINVFLITPQTSAERIRFIDEISRGFIYMVSSASTTGAQQSFGPVQQDYFRRVSEMNLRSPQIVGFGISNEETFNQATEKAVGGIIGSAFIKFLDEYGIDRISEFTERIRGAES
jgi:tryptophan synthase alpha chain